MIFKKVVLILVILIGSVVHSKVPCVEGVKILTRMKIKQGNYALKYQCLCPIDFMGARCSYHRQVRCYLKQSKVQPNSIDQNNFKEKMKISLEATMDCYVIDQQYKYKSLPQFLLKRRMKPSGLNYDLELGLDSGQIIWANSTQIFDKNGMIHGNFSEEQQQNMMYGSGPVKFTYKSNFFGLPLSDSSFFAHPKILRPSHNSITYNKIPVQFVNMQQYQKLLNQTKLPDIQSLVKDYNLKDIISNPDKANQIRKELEDRRDTMSQNNILSILPVCRVSVDVNIREAAEFQTVRIQFAVFESYRLKTAVSYTSVNSPEFFIPVRVQGVGIPPVYDVTFNKFQFSRWFYLAIFSLLLGLAYLIYKYKKRHQKIRDSKIQQNIDELQNDFAWK